MTQIAKHTLALVLALVITAATFTEAARIPAAPAASATLVA
jgi:hypothetical protein